MQDSTKHLERILKGLNKEGLKAYLSFAQGLYIKELDTTSRGRQKNELNNQLLDSDLQSADNCLIIG